MFLTPTLTANGTRRLNTYMNNVNIFDLIIYVVFDMIPQLGGIGPKSEDIVIPFRLGKGEIFQKNNPHSSSYQKWNFTVAR